MLGCAPTCVISTKSSASDNGGAQHQQQDLRQWVGHLLPAALGHSERQKMVEQGRGAGRVIHGGLRIGTDHHESRFVLSENPLLR